MINRACPRGTLSPVASVIKTLQAKLPLLKWRTPFPALLALKKVSGQVDQFLSSRRANMKADALMVELKARWTI